MLQSGVLENLGIKCILSNKLYREEFLMNHLPINWYALGIAFAVATILFSIIIISAKKKY